ncbi:MAG: hypothetical protein AB7V50_11050 [Vampirovibrionia bacterium]
MKVAIFTYKELKELLGKPSEDATRKWVDSRGLMRRSRENTNLKEVLLPYDLYQKLMERAGNPPELSNPLTEDVSEEDTNNSYDDESVVNAEFSPLNSYDNLEDSGRNAYALSTEFAEDFIRDLAQRQEALINKNDLLYNRTSELTRYQERAKILEEEMTKKEKSLSEYQFKIDNMSKELRELDVLKVKMDLVKELSDLKNTEVQLMKEKVDMLHAMNQQLELELEEEKKKFNWMKKLVGN